MVEGGGSGGVIYLAPATLSDAKSIITVILTFFGLGNIGAITNIANTSQYPGSKDIDWGY